MVAEICIYIEGGRGKEQWADLRRAFRTFLAEVDQAAHAQGVKLSPMPRGDRGRTWSDFCRALERDPDKLNLLLVDAERPVTGDVWEHLQGGEDKWQTERRLDGIYHLMAQAMEAWLIADADALERYYGNGFRRSALRTRRNVEEIPQADLVPALNAAAEDTKKAGYHKTHDGFALLEQTDPAKVRAAAPHCQRLFDALNAALQD
ncbi:MAG: DUF4276 family protein [Armatimonadetes bacterium]|nr:DUF4276 family protein [Armatimonadota bacterium]